MRTKALAACAAIALAFSLSACGPKGQRDDDDNDGGWFPVFIPWSQPHQNNNYYNRPAPAPAPMVPPYKAPPAPAPKAPAPAYKAPPPAPRAPAPAPRSK